MVPAKWVYRFAEVKNRVEDSLKHSDLRLRDFGGGHEEDNLADEKPREDLLGSE